LPSDALHLLVNGGLWNKMVMAARVTNTLGNGVALASNIDGTFEELSGTWARRVNLRFWNRFTRACQPSISIPSWSKGPAHGRLELRDVLWSDGAKKENRADSQR